MSNPPVVRLDRAQLDEFISNGKANILDQADVTPDRYTGHIPLEEMEKNCWGDIEDRSGPSLD